MSTTHWIRISSRTVMAMAGFLLAVRLAQPARAGDQGDGDAMFILEKMAYYVSGVRR